jgi:hypothetical protein
LGIKSLKGNSYKKLTDKPLIRFSKLQERILEKKILISKLERKKREEL